MSNDALFVFGFLLIVVAAPMIVAAFSESRPPRLAAVFIVLGGALIAAAMARNPGGYSFADVPKAFGRVFGSFGN